MSEQELSDAVKVLKIESESIQNAAARLGKNFSFAIDLLFNKSAKIIVCEIMGSAYGRSDQTPLNFLSSQMQLAY